MKFILRNCLSQIDLWTHLWSIFLLGNFHKRAQAAVGIAITGQMGLGYINSLDEQAKGRESVNIPPIVFASVPT